MGKLCPKQASSCVKYLSDLFLTHPSWGLERGANKAITFQEKTYGPKVNPQNTNGSVSISRNIMPFFISK